MFITMLGVGNGFSDGVLNNNALLETLHEKTLIDCGITAMQGLAALGLSEKSINSIFITHLHFDHAGGLEAFALHSKYFSLRKIHLIIPYPLKDIIWKECLAGALLNTSGNCNCLEDYFNVTYPKEGEVFRLCEDVEAIWFPTKHVKEKFSCGLLSEGQFAYTSDMVADTQLVEALGAKVNFIFHDCQMGQATVHAAYSDILNYPTSVKEKLLLMHHGLLVPPENSQIRFLRQFERIDLSETKELNPEPIQTALVRATIAYMKDLQNQECTGHDWLHTKRVYETALRLARKTSEPVDFELVAVGALLHDIDDWKFNDGDESAGPKAATAWLEKNNAPKKMIDDVCTIIRDLSFKGMGEIKKMQTLEGMIVQDADRLDAIGAIGIARTFATGATFGNYLLDPDLPPRNNLTKDKYSDRKAKSTTLNHFYEKLLHLEELMNTPAAKAEAVERQRYMIGFLSELFVECNMTNGIHQKLLSDFLK